MSEPIYERRLRPVQDDEYQSHREYWLYKVKLAVLTDRWEQAIANALTAVELPLDPPAEAGSPRSPRKRVDNEWKILTRAVEGRLKQIRERIHRTEALLLGDRSMATKEAFCKQAEQHLSRFKGELASACDKCETILTRISTRDPAGEQAIARLKGDVARYRGRESEAEGSYVAAGGKQGGASTYHGASSQLGLHALGQRVAVGPLPDPFTPTHLPLLPIKLSQLLDSQQECKVQIPFSQSELEPPPLTAI